MNNIKFNIYFFLSTKSQFSIRNFSFFFPLTALKSLAVATAMTTFFALSKKKIILKFYLYLIMTWCLLFFCVACVSSSSKQATPTAEKPNIIFIISDDQAYGDYGFMGHQHIQTPNIDQLARESKTFTKGYASAPLCSPSLATIITGLYAHQHGITGNDPKVEYEGSKGRNDGNFTPNSYPVQRDIAYQKLSDNFYKNKLITQTLTENGYRSFQAGKWWVGSATDAGFDEGMTHGDYKRGGRHGDEGLTIGREGLTPVFNFIDKSTEQKQPFFLWYAPFLPHTPHNPPKALEDKYIKLAPTPYVAKYWAMVEWFDQTTGELLQYLKDLGLEENTIIVYTCDNGWIQSDDRKRYAPKSKRSPYEGGIRTPMMFKYPKVIQPEINTHQLVSNIDIVPTILDLLTIEKGNLPGISILNKSTLSERKTIFAEAYNHDILDIEDPTSSLLYKIAIEKDWKLILPNQNMIEKAATTREENIAGFYSNEPQLFNLAADPEEEKNIATDHSAIVARLTSSIEKWWMP